MSENPDKDQDNQLFLAAIGKVTPIKSDKRSIVPSHKPKPYPKKKANQDENKLSLSHAENLQTLGAEDTFSYTAQGIQKNVLKKMRRGYYGLSAELDLHGLTSTEAKRELIKFLNYCEQNGYRCVRIIHGKGYGSENNLPVLKNDLNIWLRQYQNIQAFCSAAQKDGGAGAVVVMLRLSGKYADQDDTQY